MNPSDQQPWDPQSLEKARHELAEADAYTDSVAGEEDPGAATEDIAEDIARHKNGEPGV